MSFTSGWFLAFFAAFFVVYYALPSRRLQNVLVVAGSYFFYAWWDWRFLGLLAGISLTNYVAALLIGETRNPLIRRWLLVAAVLVSLATLFLFKYFGFFVSSVVAAGALFGVTMSEPALTIVLPLGISFMTFQGIAYVIDVSRGEHPPERDLVAFLAFKAFFPQLIAGPIERASHLLDQFHRPRELTAERADRAMWLLVMGYTLKLVVADSMARIVDAAFLPNQPFAWSTILATIAFGIQIYGDFCGYSLIAKGLALLLGFELVWNFRYPYWSTSITEFWRRWHVSLSTWLRDYLYIPLGGSRFGAVMTVRNLMITMLLGGLWHGASWNFVAWGLLHGAALAGWRLWQPNVHAAIGWCITMLIVFMGWFLFRATNLELLCGMLRSLGNWTWAPAHPAALIAIAAVALPLASVEWALQRSGDYALLRRPRWLVTCALGGAVFLCLVAARQHQVSFIYFQF